MRPTTSNAHLITKRVFPASLWSLAEPLWAQAFNAGGSRSFFLSPDWVGAWLETFGIEARAKVIVWLKEGIPTGAVVLAERVAWLAFVPLRRLYFHTAGEAPGDEVAVEHVTALAVPPFAAEVRAALVKLIRERTWDEFVLNGVDETTLTQLSHALPELRVETEWRPTYLVDLARLRASGARYDSVLSTNSRAQLRRSVKLYRERGEPTITFAATAEEALEMLGELVVLHHKRWREQGEPGAFSYVCRAFHERLIKRAFPRGGVQLVRVSAGHEPIGLLYNFVQDGVVSFYQSGLRFEEDNRLKPGQTCHALMIQECLDRGFDVYDFLASEAGGSRYKESLSTSTGRLAWSRMRRPTMRTRIITAMRAIKRRLRPVQA